MIAVHLIETEALIPAAWIHMRGQAVSAFNPSVLRVANGWIMAYRVVGPDAHRRIAMCRLDRAFRVVDGSAVPFSDGIVLPEVTGSERPRRWFADPRLYVMDGQHYVYWNTGWQLPRNHQLMQPFDPLTLRPVGPSRLLVLDAPRQDIEKNWAFLEEAPGFAVYSTTPHRVIRCDFSGDGPIACSDAVTVQADFGRFTDLHGPVRGGAPPVKVGGPYWSVGHCVSLADGSGTARYLPTLHAFQERPPFSPLRAPRAPLPLGNPLGARTVHARLNRAVGEIVYPSGAAFVEGHFVVSYGINDEHCAIAVIPYAQAVATTVPLP